MEYHTKVGNPPFSVFRDYLCERCKREWLTNGDIIGICPICKGDIDIYYQSLIKCGKCDNDNPHWLLIKKTGNTTYCYYCVRCEDQIAREAVIRILRKEEKNVQ